MCKTRKQEIAAGIAAKADTEHRFDKPYAVKKTVRVASLITVDPPSPHRMLGVEASAQPIDMAMKHATGFAIRLYFPFLMLEILRAAESNGRPRVLRIAYAASG